MAGFELMWVIGMTALWIWSCSGDKHEREHRVMMAQERAYMRRWHKQPINWRGYAYLAAYIAVPATIIKFIMWIA